MDPLTHILLTRRLIGKGTRVLAAALGPDAPFYVTYLVWVIAQREASNAFGKGEWLDPPRWISLLHYAFHRLPVAMAGAAITRAVTGRWPGRELAAWALHIVVDIPTHSREPWGPHFLWPLSDIAMEGIPWTKILIRGWKR